MKVKNEHLWHSVDGHDNLRRRIRNGIVECTSDNDTSIRASCLSVSEFRADIETGYSKPIPGQVTPAERVRRVLKTLAERKDIVGYLRKQNLKGVKNSACNCIISTFVRDRTGENIKVFPWNGRANWHRGDEDRPHRLHPSLVVVAKNFDNGQYPDLVCAA